MNSTRVSEVMKFTGKLCRLAEIGVADASGVKSHMVNTAAQFSQQTGGVDLFDPLVRVVVPLQTRVQGIAGSLDRIPALVKATAESYLRTIADELNQPESATIPALLAALAGQMTATGGSIAPSGKFWTFFQSNWGYSGFPSSGSPTYADSLITTTIV